MATKSADDSSPSFSDQEDFINARRGLIEAAKPCKVLAANGRVLWDNDAYSFLEGECPPTANPRLWRQGQLSAIQGLFEVTPAIYQIRGFDISNMTIIEGKTGIIVIDPLVSAECAKAALELYSKHRGNRPVRALIFTHSHVDHFGGAEGVLQGNYNVPIVAPDGFMEEATSENIVAGPAMLRRAAFMYGNFLPKSPTGQIGVGLGMNTSRGTNSLIPPNTLIKHTGEELTLDGLRFVFQMVPETEAPSEFNFHLPDLRTLCICECVSHTMHNIVTLRGAAVRDARAWSRHLDESLVLYGASTDVLFSSHHWPTWGAAPIARFLSEQRDLYAFMHDQTVRLMNEGLTGVQIAETLALPPGLATAWHAQGYCKFPSKLESD